MEEINIENTVDLIHKKQAVFFSSQITLSSAFRVEKLKKLLKTIIQKEKEIHQALFKDLRKSSFESMTSETIFVEKEIRKMIRLLPSWIRPQRVQSSLLNFPSRDYIIPEPYGKTLLISPWNYPFQLAITPLVGAVAAGNTVVLKPSEFAPNTAKIINEIIAEVFEPEHVTVLEGNVSMATALLKKRWDYIFFTGSTSVGKIVAKAAAEHLTPTTLELGGKSPCIVDASAPIKMTAKRIVWGKFLNCGQTCIAPDFLLVDKKIKAELTQQIIKEIQKAYGEDQSLSADYGRIIHEKHLNRLKDYLHSQNIVFGGNVEEDNLYFGPTIVDEPELDSPLMKEEVFGPILPIVSYESEQHLHGILENRERPLAFYVFSKKNKFVNSLFGKYSFGGGVANDSIIHFANDNLPFGGIGNSGMGAYHGKHSLALFTHKKPVVKRSFWFDVPGRYAPYPKSLSFLKFLIKNL